MPEEVNQAAVRQYGTPLYLYDLDKFRENIVTLNAHLPLNSGLYFSVKANPLEKLCVLAYQKGCGLEVASDGELQLAIKAGVLPEHIAFTGPGKTEDELIQAVRAGIYMINVESFREIQMIQRIAAQEGKMVAIALRINPAERKTKGKVQMSGTASQFGIEETELTSDFFQKIQIFPNICLSGIHIYMGTSILDAGEICQNTEYAIRLGIELSKRHSFELKYINAGGGFGVPYFPGEKEFDMELMLQGMKKIEEKYNEQLKDSKVYFESGRYLLADCGQFLIRVLYRKESKGNIYLVCDGGANFHSASAFLGRFVRGNFPMHVMGKMGNEMEFYVTGPSCTPTDLVGQKVKLPEDTEEGDIIVIEKSGAYGLTYSPYGFLSHSLPMEIGYEKKTGFVELSKHSRE